LSVALERLRFALSDRPAQRALGAAGIVLFLLGVGVAIVNGDLKIIAILLTLLAAPFLMTLAFARPYLFPYGLYVVLIPFDDLLALGGGGTLTKIVGIATAVAVIVHAVRARRFVRPPFVVAVASLYVGWMLVTSLWAIDIGQALTNVQTMLSLLLLFVILASAPIDERDLRTICGFIVLSGVLAAIYGIWFFHQNPPSSDGRLVLGVTGRQVDPNVFADSLLAPLALAVVALLHARRIHSLLPLLLAVAIIGEGIIISLSREAMLGCVAIALVVVFMSRRRLLALAVLVPSLALIPLLVPEIGQRMAEAGSTGGAGRTGIWQVDVHAWLMHPIFGWGAGSAMEAYSANLLRVAPTMFSGWDRPPHNAPLQTLVELGVIGLVLVIVTVVLAFRMMRTIRRGGRLYDLRVGLTAALTAVVVASFFIDNLSEKYVWLVLAAVAQLRIVQRLQPAAPQPVVYEPPPGVALRGARSVPS
jgi:O-antigen ligase